MKKNLLFVGILLSSLSIVSCNEKVNSDASFVNESTSTTEMASVSSSVVEEVSSSVVESESVIKTSSVEESVSVAPEVVSIAKAIEIASSLPVGKDSEGDHITATLYTISGTLVVDGKNYSLTDGTDTIKLYYFMSTEDKALVHDGYEVSLTGNLENYGYSEDAGTPELVNIVINNFEACKYNVTIPALENGTITGKVAELDYGESVTYTITPSTGYKVEEVKFNGNIVDVSTGSFKVTIEKNSTIEASFVSEDTTVASIAAINFANYATANKWEDKKQYTSVNVDHVTITCSKGTNTGKYYASDNTWRIYSSDSASITITLDEGYAFESITFKYNLSVSKVGPFKDYKDSVEVAISGSSLTITADVKTFITDIIVKYNAVATTSTEA